MKTYAILISLVAAGLVLSLLHSIWPSDHWTSVWFVQLASVLVIGGGLGIIDKTLLRKDHFNQTRDLFRVHESATHLGLAEITQDANRYSYSEMIRESESLSIVLNDGRTWISARMIDFKHRFSQDYCTTELFLPDPKGKFVAVLAEKTGYAHEEQANKIDQSSKRVIEEFRNSGSHGKLKIYHIPHYVTHSIFFSSEVAAISLYGISTPRRSVPLFSFRKTNDACSLYADIGDDVEKLRKESLCIFDSQKKQPNIDPANS